MCNNLCEVWKLQCVSFYDPFSWLLMWPMVDSSSRAGFLLNKCFRDAHFLTKYISKFWKGSINCSPLSKENPPGCFKVGLYTWKKQNTEVQWQIQDHWQLSDLERNGPFLPGTQSFCLQNERIENAFQILNLLWFLDPCGWLMKNTYHLHRHRWNWRVLG